MAARTGPIAPTGLQKRGRRLWREVIGQASLDPGQVVLLEEACRTVDRLDKLDRILTGEDAEWIGFQQRYEGDDVTITLNAPIAEARQQALALQKLVAALSLNASLEAKPTGDGIDELLARRAARFG